MPALHVILGPQTATKLDEIAIVTEESKTAIVARLIREEWDREREKRSGQPIVVNQSWGGPPGDVTHTVDELVDEVRRGLVTRYAVEGGH